LSDLPFSRRCTSLFDWDSGARASAYGVIGKTEAAYFNKINTPMTRKQT